MRYQFYREHKYVSSALNDLERLAAKTDFSNSLDSKKLQEEFEALKAMLEGHAQWENEQIHELLRRKHSKIQEEAEKDHLIQDEQLAHLQKLLHQIEGAALEEQIQKGYQFYLTYRKFVSDNLAHLHEEETIILPELQRLYTDEELRKVDFGTYHKMTPEEMVEMMEVLFPHMNRSDRAAFFKDMNDSEPKKFKIAWEKIKSKIPSEERANF